MIFKRLNTACILFVVLFTNYNLLAQSKLPYDSATGRIMYKFEVELDKPYKKQALYMLMQDWIKDNYSLFHASNTPDTGKAVTVDKKKNADKEAVMREFENLTPLQSIDPESNRVSGKGILKYTGSSNGCIRLFYVQYALVAKIEGNRIVGELCNYRYNHFNQRSFTPQPVFNWSGMMPCDQVNTLEYLTNCEACHNEFVNFYSFLNSNADEVIKSFSTAVKGNKVLTANTNSD